LDANRVLRRVDFPEPEGPHRTMGRTATIFKIKIKKKLKLARVETPKICPFDPGVQDNSLLERIPATNI
jgi:hypothetical protein